LWACIALTIVMAESVPIIQIFVVLMLQITQTVIVFTNPFTSKMIFFTNVVNGTIMCLLVLGSLISRLSDDLKLMTEQAKQERLGMGLIVLLSVFMGFNIIL
jgi:hypothetical protein